MESCCFWRILLLAGAAAVSATTLPLQQKALSYEQAVMLAMNLYNQNGGGNFTFQLLKAAPQPKWLVKERAGQTPHTAVVTCDVATDKPPAKSVKRGITDFLLKEGKKLLEKGLTKNLVKEGKHLFQKILSKHDKKHHSSKHDGKIEREHSPSDRMGKRG